ncbi:receptor-like protein EIX2 [Senna tora]|uniref:Receptor-like protein EIX2 n=1 Tax=Senna tora TaxID=362788 RepID=A0A834SDA8_9FABA|nr:receptor-like protein EIX2 [Senna tora]
MTKSCVETDKQALLRLKDGFTDDANILFSWKSEVDCCLWDGISCNNLTGHVTKLNIPVKGAITDDGVGGNITSSLCELQHLTHLDISFNSLEGSKIPKCIGSLVQLRELILSDNSLVGTIPNELGNLSNLHTLDLGWNENLIANELEWIPHLSSLRYLDLSDVNLSGATDWQTSLARKALSQLRKLILSDASLVGTIPHELGNLSNLHTLVLRGNFGLITNDLEWISHLSSLRYLDLSHVNLSRVLDWQISLSCQVPSLLELHIANCSLPQVNYSKSFFLHMNSSTSLKVLSLASNQLDSSILSWVSNISKVLVDLDLSYNSLQLIPPNSLNMNSLKRLNLKRNSLQLIPGAFSAMKALEFLQLEDDSLQHIVPKAFSNMLSLRTLELNGCSSLQRIAPDAFTNTTSVEHLDFGYNKLESSIVKSISSNLCQLKELKLTFNHFSGQLSDWIPMLGCAQYSIVTLDLSQNPFNSGPFPNFSRFHSLEGLNLRNTSLHGSIPPSFRNLPHLIKLDLSHNNLSGVLPEFDGLSSLQSLDLSNNKLTEFSRNTFGQVSSLVVLVLSSNSSDWVPSFQLYQLYASSCIIGPDFPKWLKYQTNVESLDFSDGQISNAVPQWIWLSPSLTYLNLSGNKIHGELPKSLPKIKLGPSAMPYTWDLSSNKFSGPISYFPPNALLLDFSNNQFSGSISSFCATPQSKLGYFDLSNNLLSGSLPDCNWERLEYLGILNLANNDFSGRIPNSIGTLKNIVSVHLNNNKFFGEMPSLMNSPNLAFIDLGQNNLHGELPMWIGHSMPKLIGLRLQENKFQGSIPTCLCNMPLLQILDLSHNNFTGRIPHCLHNLSSLSNVTFSRKIMSYNLEENFMNSESRSTLIIDIAKLAWKGKYIEYGKNLGLMTTIDLSCNHLEGEIPRSIITLVALASLNLSRNDLTGFIPSKMGEMKMLESLDLSSNSLSGGIPTSFSSLSFLSCLNLSFNNLSGEIPQTTQLQTFDASSYEGNQGLCGLPLAKCTGDASFDPSIHHIEDAMNKDDLISFGFYVSMILGFIVGFWGVCGTLVVKSSWRHAYFRFFSDMNDWIHVQVVVFWARMKRRFR